ncbi:ATP-dependent nuclease [Paracoccus yeei]|uniref:ATP-dependent nuclease n=1 Tax=Paracoccus yeei TaxID=147645 RepID=UPI0020C314AD|nr:AAA family ATPase [Paracoccus yeei]
MPIVDRLNQELRGFFRTNPTLHLRVTPTDSDGLLESVVSHYSHNGADVPLPAKRHGSGLLSLQHLLLLLQFGRLRVEADENFWMALEEPELHVPPALQRRLVHRIQSLSRQTLVSTHSPMVAALADPSGVAVLRNEGGVLTSVPLLQSTLPANTPNSVRKLFQVNRVETIAAVMHEFVLIPEGRTDYEWLALLVRAVDLHQGWAAADECRFDAFVGVIPTHGGSVVRAGQRRRIQAAATRIQRAARHDVARQCHRLAAGRRCRSDHTGAARRVCHVGCRPARSGPMRQT